MILAIEAHVAALENPDGQGPKMDSIIIGDSQMSHYLSDRPPDGD